MEANSYSFSVTEKEFEQKVIERSKSVPVVVDFWASWCGPCRTLGPLLESAIKDKQGSVLLAKVDVDQNPNLSQKFRVQGIPAVKAFRDGKVFREFVGLLPKEQIDRFLDSLVPSKADIALSRGETALEENRLEEAKEAFHNALIEKPNWPPAKLGKAKTLLLQEQIEEAKEEIIALPLGSKERIEGDALLTNLQFAKDARKIRNADEAKKQLETHKDDLETHWNLSSYYAYHQDYKNALAGFLALVQKDRSFREDGARHAMLAIFATLGKDNEHTIKFRRRLSMIL